MASGVRGIIKTELKHFVWCICVC